MTCLALAEKCGALGARELLAVADAAKSRSLNSEASATPPMPTPQFLKKCRRVMARKCSEYGFITQFLVTVSSRFKRTLPTTVQAANWTGSSDCFSEALEKVFAAAVSLAKCSRSFWATATRRWISAAFGTRARHKRKA